jgi:hypothetical protein
VRADGFVGSLQCAGNLLPLTGYCNKMLGWYLDDAPRSEMRTRNSSHATRRTQLDSLGRRPRFSRLPDLECVRLRLLLSVCLCPRPCPCPCQVTYLEIYNEHLRDLLDHRFAFNKQMDIKNDPETGLPQVSNLIAMDVLDADVVYSLLARANKARATAATESNLRSSRSHGVFTVRWERVC